MPTKKISQADTRDLLEKAAEVVVWARSWGLHLDNPSMLTRHHADTGKPLPFDYSQSCIGELEAAVTRLREKSKVSA